MLKKIKKSSSVKKQNIHKQKGIIKKQTAKKIKKVTKNKRKINFGRVALISVRTIAFIILGSLTIFSSVVYAYKDNFKEKAFYGTKVMGEDVGGKTLPEIEQILSKKISEVKLSFLIDGQNISVKPEEAGLYFERGDSAKRALESGKKGKWYEPYLNAGASLIYKTGKSVAAAGFENIITGNVEMKYRIDEQRLYEFTQSLSTKFNIESKNAGLVMNGTEVQVIPAVYGRKIVVDSVRLQMMEAIKSTNTSQVQIDVEKINPAIIENDTKESIDAAKNLLNIPIKYHYNGQNYTPDKATVGGWVIFNEQDVNGQKKLVPAVDANRAAGYIYSLAQKINIAAINKKVTIRNGAEQVVEQEGKDGLAVDVNRAAQTTASNLSSGNAIDLELPTYVIKSKTMVNNIIVADWAKYIEINISTQTMTAYEAGGKIVGSWKVTTGNKYHSTPVGTWLVIGKSAVTTMSGGTPGVDYYNLPNVHWVSWFKGGGYSIHEAWWRSSFGGSDYLWNGSHGCVNSPYSVAEFIYYWAPVGTPVIIHY